MDRSNIQAIIKKYRESKIQSEAEVRSKLIVPLLEELGYASKYRAEEFPVYGYGGREKLPAKNADFLLFDNEEFAEHRDRTPENNEWVREHSLLVVEAKKPGKIPEEPGQAQYYTMWTRAVAYIETDGEEVFGYYYNPVSNDHKVLQVSVDELSASEVLEHFTYESVLRTKGKGNQFVSLAGHAGGGNSVLTTPYSEEGAFIVSHPFQYFGHETEISEVLSWIGTHKIIFVYGEGGIGKTEFCREVLIQANTKYYAVNLIECRDFSQFISRVAGVLGIPVSADDTPAMVERRVLEGLRQVSGILYLDNFEDAMSEAKTEKAERRRVLDFLRKCIGDIPVTVLISSRKRIQGVLNKIELELKPLDDDSAVSLFMEIWGGDEDERIRRFVIDDLCNFPLAIILAATHMAYYASSIEELKAQWAKARETVRIEGMENERHESVATALSITYEEVKADENARRLWELFTLFPDTIDIDTADRIIPDCYSARVKLTDLSVLHKDGKMLSMLPLLREYVKETKEYREDLEVLSERLLEYYSDVFKVNRSTEMGTERDLRAVDALGDALYFMDCMVGEKDADAVGEMHSLLCEFYKERPYEAIEVVSRAINQVCFDEGWVKANIIEYLGDLEMRTDKLEEAENHYREAEGVCRRIHEDLGLANVLQAMGDLEMRTDKLKEAEKHYVEAEGVYRRIHSDLGLANVLKAMGDLEQGKNHYRQAIVYYEKSVHLYEKTKGRIGMAYTSAELCYCCSEEGKIEKVLTHWYRVPLRNDYKCYTIIKRIGEEQAVDSPDGYSIGMSPSQRNFRRYFSWLML